MGFFSTEEDVNEYLKLAEEFDGAKLIKIFQEFVPKKSPVLELGIEHL